MANSRLPPTDSAGKYARQRAQKAARRAHLLATLVGDEFASYIAKEKATGKAAHDRHRAKIAADPERLAASRHAESQAKKRRLAERPLEERRPAIAKRNKNYYEKLQQDPERLAEYHRKGREKAAVRRANRTPEEITEDKEKQRISREKNKEKISAKKKKRRKEKPEEKRISEAKRRAAKRGAEGSFKAEDIAAILKAQKGKCAVCRTCIKKKYEIDHIKPLAKGGSNHRRNLQLLCPPCNSRKHAKDPIDFMREKGFLL